MSKTIIVSNRLPIRIEEKQGELKFKTSEGGLATALGSIYKEGGNIWVGWPGLTTENPDQQRDITRHLVDEHMRPVFLSAQEVQDYYLGFSNQTLWPAFHYFVQYIRYDADQWQAYQKVNQKFADEIIKYAQPDDIIWVHDYQLLLLPQMLRERLPEASIGFFQHIPFPSFEIFRMLPWRRKLLKGILGSDFVGFHTYDDMRHFLSSAHRLDNHAYRGNTVEIGGRVVAVDSLPMGIDYDKYAGQADSTETRKIADEFRKEYRDQKIILSVDRLDYSKGIPDRLRAYRDFLAKNPGYQGKVSLILVVVPSRDKVPSYSELKDEVDELTGAINGEYASPNWRPISYFYRSFPLPELSAFYRMSDVAMVTPLRDGMNLVCKEFVASRTEKDGVLILSEMAGSAKELSEAIMVNPNDRQSLIRALEQALEMPTEEQRKRIEIMQDSLKKYTIFNWVSLFNERFEDVKAEQRKMNSRILRDEDVESIKNNFKAADNKLVLLDYDGTLVPFYNDPEDSIPGEELMKLLGRYRDQENTELVIISGRPAKFLDQHLGGLGITMAAEHGIWMKEKGGEWKMNVELPDEVWKAKSKAIMESYVDRTPGSFLEEKKNALVWHFRKVETGLAELRSSELASHLDHVLDGYPIDVMEGNAIVEVKPSAINKGSIALKLYQASNPDFTLTMGDDRTDEYIFEALPENCYTIKVGITNTHARFSISDQKFAIQLLKALID